MANIAKDALLEKRNKLREELASLDQQYADYISERLKNLPTDLGISAEELVTKLAEIHTLDAGKLGPKLLEVVHGLNAGDMANTEKAGGKRRGRPAGAQAASGAKRGGRRATITDEIKAQVVKMAKDGKTGAEIAKATGISLPSVQNIKKDAGLVKARK